MSIRSGTNMIFYFPFFLYVNGKKNHKTLHLNIKIVHLVEQGRMRRLWMMLTAA